MPLLLAALPLFRPLRTNMGSCKSAVSSRSFWQHPATKWSKCNAFIELHKQGCISRCLHCLLCIVSPLTWNWCSKLGNVSSFCFYCFSFSFIMPFFFLFFRSSSSSSSSFIFSFISFPWFLFSFLVSHSLASSNCFMFSPLFFPSPFLFLCFPSLLFLFLSSSDGRMRCVKSRWAKTLPMPDIIFVTSAQAFAFHRERSSKEGVSACVPVNLPLWPRK